MRLLLVSYATSQTRARINIKPGFHVRDAPASAPFRLARPRAAGRGRRCRGPGPRPPGGAWRARAGCRPAAPAVAVFACGAPRALRRPLQAITGRPVRALLILTVVLVHEPELVCPPIVPCPATGTDLNCAALWYTTRASSPVGGAGREPSVASSSFGLAPEARLRAAQAAEEEEDRRAHGWLCPEGAALSWRRRRRGSSRVFGRAV